MTQTEAPTCTAVVSLSWWGLQPAAHSCGSVLFSPCTHACAVVAVDQVRQAIANRLAQQAAQQQQGQSSAESRDGQQETEGSTEAGAATGGAGGSAASPGSRPQVPLRPPTSIEVDWWLWEQGEKNRRSHRPHHRTLTVYY